MFTRILVATDFSTHSDAALDYARTLAAKFGSSMHLLHVLEDPYVPSAFGAVPEICMSMDEPAGRTVLLEDTKARLARLTKAEGHCRPATTEVLFGSAAHMIPKYAALNGCDLIVMGTHGRTGLAQVLRGSVAERIVRTAPCPVLTVRADVESRRVDADLVSVAAA